ncbi:hypothetical protein [Streptomyces sp. NPDC056817]|uniref:hypothetical protein n=1 Tax=Streptomyces sp. NPDC056817 TaxID=3345950 RepID=UPI0036BCA83B
MLTQTARRTGISARAVNEIPDQARSVGAAYRRADLLDQPECADVDDDQELVVEDLTREQVLDWRNRAAADHQIVHDHIARYSERSAQRLFTRSFVATVQRLSGLGHLDLGYTPWGQT